jgi:hypothetical protein
VHPLPPAPPAHPSRSASGYLKDAATAQALAAACPADIHSNTQLTDATLSFMDANRSERRAGGPRSARARARGAPAGSLEGRAHRAAGIVAGTGSTG